MQDNDKEKVVKDVDLSRAIIAVQEKVKNLQCAVCKQKSMEFKTVQFMTRDKAGKTYRITPKNPGAGVIGCTNCGNIVIPDIMKPYLEILPLNRRQRRMVESDNKRFSKRIKKHG